MTPEDICDVDGKKTPLHCMWKEIDWVLLDLRFEIRYVCLAFTKDVTSADRDRRGILSDLFGFYYKKFTKKQLAPQRHGFETERDLLAYFGDIVKADKDKVLTLVHGENEPFSTLIRLNEVSRRVRYRRLAAGDETARLKPLPGFAEPAPPVQGATKLQAAALTSKGKGAASAAKGIVQAPRAPLAVRPQPPQRPLRARFGLTLS